MSGCRMWWHQWWWWRRSRNLSVIYAGPLSHGCCSWQLAGSWRCALVPPPPPPPPRRPKGPGPGRYRAPKPEARSAPGAPAATLPGARIQRPRGARSVAKCYGVVIQPAASPRRSKPKALPTSTDGGVTDGAFARAQHGSTPSDAISSSRACGRRIAHHGRLRSWSSLAPLAVLSFLLPSRHTRRSALPPGYPRGGG
jgi:hypothetical protein